MLTCAPRFESGEKLSARKLARLQEGVEMVDPRTGGRRRRKDYDYPFRIRKWKRPPDVEPTPEDWRTVIVKQGTVNHILAFGSDNDPFPVDEGDGKIVLPDDVERHVIYLEVEMVRLVGERLMGSFTGELRLIGLDYPDTGNIDTYTYLSPYGFRETYLGFYETWGEQHERARFAELDGDDDIMEWAYGIPGMGPYPKHEKLAPICSQWTGQPFAGHGPMKNRGDDRQNAEAIWNVDRVEVKHCALEDLPETQFGVFDWANVRYGQSGQWLTLPIVVGEVDTINRRLCVHQALRGNVTVVPPAMRDSAREHETFGGEFQIAHFIWDLGKWGTIHFNSFMPRDEITRPFVTVDAKLCGITGANFLTGWPNRSALIPHPENPENEIPVIAFPVTLFRTRRFAAENYTTQATPTWQWWNDETF